jgi:hypothetical protein
MSNHSKTSIRALIVALTVASAFAVAITPAFAAPCEKCESEESGEGGGGPGSGGGSGASRVTVAGSFRYRDSDTDPATGARRLRPIAHARVEIWRFAPHIGPVWTWAHDETATTDANGSLSVSMPFETRGIVYALRVTATNYAAKVWPNDALHSVPFHQEPGEPDGMNIHRTANEPGETLDFSYDFTDAWTPQHFNMAEAVRHGFDYASANRDPAETEPIPQVGVQPTSVTGTWYNAPSDTVVINSADVFEDLVVLHEYAHYLEEQLGSLPWNVTLHDGCTTRIIGGAIANSAGHAWMEGFAAYFAHTVDASAPSAALTGSMGTFSRGRLEAPGSCPPLPAEFTSDEQDIFVAASLWDAFDRPSDFTPASSEPADTLERRDREIFQIMDRELDMATSIAGPFPTIFDFSRAWSARGLPVGALDQILTLNNIATLPTAGGGDEPPPEEQPPADQVCLQKSWTPGCE